MTTPAAFDSRAPSGHGHKQAESFLEAWMQTYVVDRDQPARTAAFVKISYNEKVAARSTSMHSCSGLLTLDHVSTYMPFQR